MPLTKEVREELAKAKARLQAGYSYKRFELPKISLDDPWDDEHEKQSKPLPPVFRTQAPSTEANEDVIEDCDDGPPAQASKHIPNGCVPIVEVHEDFRQIFPYPFFNKVQSECFEIVYYSDENVVVSAPTSSGKTVVMELAIVRLMLKTMGANGSLQNRTRGAAKVVYMAPIKALCQQIAADWRSKFQSLGITCIELTGDSEDWEYPNLISSDIILTTPEKWDSVTRKWKDNKTIMGQIALLLIDEVHLLNEDRGATLEAVVSRMNTLRSFELMQDCPSASLRFIGLSATIPNIEDIGEWLNVPVAGVKAFGQEYRPVKVEVKVLGYPKCKNDYMFDNNLNFKLLDLIKTHSSGKPSLVFCSTRKNTMAAAGEIAKGAVRARNTLIKNAEHMNRLAEASQRTSDKSLAECIRAGVGYHTAGMQLRDRSLVEELFLAGELAALCATSTLAQGVNFPAHLVIVKSTQFYKSGFGFKDRNEMTVAQMIGRAGRPQFDTSAVAIIMTQAENKQKWENILNGKQPIESNLLGHITEHLNSEIVLKTITDISVAINWLKSTFLFKRIGKNPSHYGIEKNLTSEQLDKRLHGILLNSIHELANCKLIEIDDGFTVRPLEAGICMARFYIEFSTMKQFTEIAPDASLDALIQIISNAKEFEDVVLRQDEKRKLYDISKKPEFRFGLDGKIKSNDMKVNCLIQATLGNIQFEEWSLKQESQHIFSSASRLLRGMVHFLAEKKCFTALYSALLLEKCFKQRMWENSKLILKQLDKIGTVFAGNLAAKGIDTFDKLSETDPRLIEKVLARNFPFGNEVKQSLASIPKYKLQIEQVGEQRILILVTRVNQPKVSGFNFWHLLIADSCNDLIYYKKLQTNSTVEYREEFNLPPPNSIDHKLVAWLINDEYIGLDSQVTLTPTYSKTKHADTNQRNRDVQPTTAHDEDAWLDKAYYEYQASTENLPDFGDETPVGTITMTTPPEKPIAECKHACKDKTKCKHACCKGLRASYKRKHTEDDIIDLTGRTRPNKLTEYFQPVNKPKAPDQVVPDTRDDFTDIDPHWFDDPFELPIAGPLPDETFDFAGPNEIATCVPARVTTYRPPFETNNNIQNTPKRIKLGSLKPKPVTKPPVDHNYNYGNNGNNSSRVVQSPLLKSISKTPTSNSDKLYQRPSFVTKYLNQQNNTKQNVFQTTPSRPTGNLSSSWNNIAKFDNFRQYGDSNTNNNNFTPISRNNNANLQNRYTTNQVTNTFNRAPSVPQNSPAQSFPSRAIQNLVPNRTTTLPNRTATFPNHTETIPGPNNRYYSTSMSNVQTPSFSARFGKYSSTFNEKPLPQHSSNNPRVQYNSPNNAPSRYARSTSTVPVGQQEEDEYAYEERSQEVPSMVNEKYATGLYKYQFSEQDYEDIDRMAAYFEKGE